MMQILREACDFATFRYSAECLTRIKSPLTMKLIILIFSLFLADISFPFLFTVSVQIPLDFHTEKSDLLSTAAKLCNPIIHVIVCRANPRLLTN